MRLLIASDHAGFQFKTVLQKLMPHYDWHDLGPAQGASCDYPDFAQRLAQKISQGEADLGVLICGSGVGMSIAANKVSGVRAALVSEPVSARLAREHNHANVLCLGSRFIAPEYGQLIVESWINATPDPDERHLRRVSKIQDIERN